MSNLSAKDKKLQKKWYDKLKKEGFVDIEQDEDTLKSWHSQLFINRHTNFTEKSGKREAKFDATWFTSQEEYYRLAGIFLHDHEFKSDIEKLIWELHSAGENKASIYRELVSRNRKVHREGIYKIIKTLANIMVEELCQSKKT